MKTFLLVPTNRGTLPVSSIQADRVRDEGNGDFAFMKTDGQILAVFSREVLGGYVQECEENVRPERQILDKAVIDEIEKQVEFRMSQFKIELPG